MRWYFLGISLTVLVLLSCLAGAEKARGGSLSELRPSDAAIVKGMTDDGLRVRCRVPSCGSDFDLLVTLERTTPIVGDFAITEAWMTGWEVLERLQHCTSLKRIRSRRQLFPTEKERLRQLFPKCQIVVE